MFYVLITLRWCQPDWCQCAVERYSCKKCSWLWSICKIWVKNRGLWLTAAQCVKNFLSSFCYYYVLYGACCGTCVLPFCYNIWIFLYPFLMGSGNIVTVFPIYRHWWWGRYRPWHTCWNIWKSESQWIQAWVRSCYSSYEGSINNSWKKASK